MEKLVNPFVIGRYVSDDYFCDREQETDFLIKQILNGRNVALISPRRMGKSGLIEHTLGRESIRRAYYTFFIDIYATSSLSELVLTLGKNIIDRLRPGLKGWTERFFEVVRSLRAGWKIDAFTGEPSFELSIGEIQSPQTTLDEIFDYLEGADRPCIVAVDEFQQIGSYRERNVEALLRTKIQHCKNTFFIFSGSQRHLMSNMFNSAAKPFYQSAISMSLEPIKMETYIAFASGLFSRYEKQVERGLIERVYNTFEGCTWFVQMMLNEIFALTPEGGKADESLYDEAERNVISVQEGSYKDILSNLSPKQRELLYAVARERRVKAATGASFIKKYALASASSVQVALRALTDSDILTRESDGSIRIYDYFFADWLRRR